MKERPILYSTPMVQAKLDGRKTQTRRVMKIQPDNDCYFQMTIVKRVNGGIYCMIDYNQGEENPFVRCPYGAPGDVLWTRETWCRDLEVDGGFLYRASNPEAEREDGDGSPWKASIHMPKVAARIWERITSVRVERLQDISEWDVIAEGILSRPYDKTGRMSGTIFYDYIRKTYDCILAQTSYQTLWESINGEGSWELNPWVFVIETEILSTTGRNF